MTTTLVAHEELDLDGESTENVEAIRDTAFPAQTLVKESETSGRFRGQTA